MPEPIQMQKQNIKSPISLRTVNDGKAGEMFLEHLDYVRQDLLQNPNPAPRTITLKIIFDLKECDNEQCNITVASAISLPPLKQAESCKADISTKGILQLPFDTAF